ncbi:MAG: hypothetical protein MUC88_28745 [Planctomycetes bacterium]|nr:hypothetical protein [Planctomycetota bacterium]
MPRSMLVALWLRRTPQANASNRQCLDYLASALELTKTKLKAISHGKKWAKPKVIFVAPEYLFGHKANRRRPGDRFAGIDYRGVNEEQANKIFRALKNLSAKYDNFLIVPGTIAWYKLLGSLNKDQLSAAKQRLDTYAPPSGGPHSWTTAQKKAAVDNFLTARKKWWRNADEKAVLQEARFCLNSAPVLYNGRCPIVYSKKGDYDESLQWAPPATTAYQVAMPGKQEGTFTVEGIRFGIEICLDHNIGILGGSAAIGASPPLIHIITSASVQVEPNKCVPAPGGYVINACPADSLVDPYGRGFYGVWTNGGTGLFDPSYFVAGDRNRVGLRDSVPQVGAATTPDAAQLLFYEISV